MGNIRKVEWSKNYSTSKSLFLTALRGQRLCKGSSGWRDSLQALWSKCSAFYYWFELRLIFLGFLVSPLGPAPKTPRLKWKWKVLIKSTIYLSLKIDPKSTWGLVGGAPGNKLLSCLVLQVFNAKRAVKSCISVAEICKILAVSSSSVPAQSDIWGLKHIWPLASIEQELQVLSVYVSRRWVHVMCPPPYLMYRVSELNWVLLALKVLSSFSRVLAKQGCHTLTP